MRAPCVSLRHALIFMTFTQRTYKKLKICELQFLYIYFVKPQIGALALECDFLFAFWMIVDRRHNASWLIVVAAQRQRLWLPIEEVLDNITSATDTHCLIIVYQRRISYSVHVFGSPVTSRWPMAHGLWHRAPGNPRQTCVSSPWLIKSSASSGIGLPTQVGLKFRSKAASAQWKKAGNCRVIQWT